MIDGLCPFLLYPVNGNYKRNILYWRKKPVKMFFLKKALTRRLCCDIILKHAKVHLGVAQLVARYLGVVEAAGSSPVTQTISSIHNGLELWILDFLYQHVFTDGGGE